MSTASQGGLDLEALRKEFGSYYGNPTTNRQVLDLIDRFEALQADERLAHKSLNEEVRLHLKSKARLASLQRVREAAVELQYSASWAKAEAGPYTLVPAAILKALRAALADSEEGR